ncbi:MAG: aminopeptidase [Patescibacteria group bacterium]
MTPSFSPSKTLIDRYADVLVNFALNSGKGLKKGEVVDCVVPDEAKPLALALQNAILKSGGHPMIRLIPTGFDKDYYTLANEAQLKFFPIEYYQQRAKLVDHQIGVIADVDPRELEHVDMAKIMMARNARKAYRDWLTEKELKGKFTWTIALWGVEAKAKEVGLTLEEYWKQISKACFLDKKDPIGEWQKIFVLQKAILKKINSMEIESVHVFGPDADIVIRLGADRAWFGGSGRNIPSFECFTSPDWRGTEGWIYFNQPLYRYGNVMRDIRLEFHNGLVSKAHAKVGNTLLQEMLKTPNANKLGEYSLTDKRMSRITHIMAETLFDENIGGPQGNTHLAIGMSYKDCFKGDASKLTKADWEKRGFNDSAEHTDIISTTPRTVTATLTNGVQKVIYKNGMFVD